MPISKYVYPSYTYIDNDTDTLTTHYATESEKIKYSFGNLENVYTRTGFIDDRIILMSNLNSILMEVLSNIDGNSKVWQFTSGTGLRNYKTTIRLYSKKVTSDTGSNIELQCNFECRAYEEDKSTPTSYGGSNHKWTRVVFNITTRLRNGTTNLISTGYNPYLVDEWYKGVYDLPYSDSLYLMGVAFSTNNENFCVHPIITAEDLENSTTLTNYVNSIDNICLIGNAEMYTDTRDRIYYTTITINNNLKTFFTNWYNTGVVNNSDVPPPVDDDNVGNNDDSSDFIPNGDLPSINSFSSGLITAYTMETGALNSLSDFLWDDNFIQSLPKLVNNPMDAIICLKSYPINLSAYGSVANIKIGGIDTEISATKVNTQYVMIDCGILNIHEYYGDFTDYDNTTVLINLPYVGEHVLPTDEVLESTLHLYYKVDLLTGACMAQVEILKNRFGTILQGSIYNFKGNLATDYPLTGQIYGNIINALSGLFTTNFAMALNSGNNIVNGERKIEINGNHSSNFGALGTQVPYVKIVSPIQNNPQSYNVNLGSYSNKTASIGSLKGYTEIDAINLKILGATDNEMQEIKTALYNGVVIY